MDGRVPSRPAESPVTTRLERERDLPCPTPRQEEENVRELNSLSKGQGALHVRTTQHSQRNLGLYRQAEPLIRSADLARRRTLLQSGPGRGQGRRTGSRRPEP